VSNGNGERDTGEQPVVVETDKGMTVLLGGRHLYSSRDPARAPVVAASSVTIQPESLVICFSPILGYGLSELLARLPEKCVALAVERDERLMALSLERCDGTTIRHPAFRYVRSDSPTRVVEYLDSLGLPPFRRCVRVDLSGGVALFPEFYESTARLLAEYIARFWKNRVTLIRLGRNYARNFFRNLPGLAQFATTGFRQASLPIAVAGAGPSLDKALVFLRERREDVFLLAVDTALRPLSEAGITPDAVILLESQFWIERAFIGFRGNRVPIFADLTARPDTVAAPGGDRSYFLSQYARLRYLERFRSLNLDVPIIPALGSVGLAAIRLSLQLSRPEAPIFAVGLDFSWNRGYSHSRGAEAPAGERWSSSRVAPILSVVPDFAEGATVATAKNGAAVRTNPSLAGYADLCAASFRNAHPAGIFDIGEEGLECGMIRISEQEASSLLDRFGRAEGETDGRVVRGGYEPPRQIKSGSRETICAFLAEEKKRLETIRSALTGESAVDDRSLRESIAEADYLFAHFPDGHAPKFDDVSFLRRVRVEIDFFLKTIDIALGEMR